MSQSTTGEDILAVLFAVILILVFISLLSDSISYYKNKSKQARELKSVLSISDSLKSGQVENMNNNLEYMVLNEYFLKNNLSKFIERWRMEGMRTQIEIILLEDDNFARKERLENKYSYSLSFPVVFKQNGTFRPANMLIRIEK